MCVLKWKYSEVQKSMTVKENAYILQALKILYRMFTYSAAMQRLFLTLITVCTKACMDSTRWYKA